MTRIPTPKQEDISAAERPLWKLIKPVLIAAVLVLIVGGLLISDQLNHGDARRACASFMRLARDGQFVEAYVMLDKRLYARFPAVTDLEKYLTDGRAKPVSWTFEHAGTQDNGESTNDLMAGDVTLADGTHMNLRIEVIVYGGTEAQTGMIRDIHVMP